MNAQTELIRKLSESSFNEIARETESVVVINTSDSGVRESAIWAFAFLGGKVKKLAVEIRKSEKDKKVLEFLEEVEKRNSAELWFMRKIEKVEL